jgi:hypothetical protein
MAGMAGIAIKNTQLVPKEWPYSAPRNSPGAYATAIGAATMREIGVTDSTNQVVTPVPPASIFRQITPITER